MANICRFEYAVQVITRGWLWVAFGGILNIVLGVLVYIQWPNSGLWVIGMFISVELIIHGINAITLSSIVKEVQKEMK